VWVGTLTPRQLATGAPSLHAFPKVRTTKLSPLGGTGKSISVVMAWVPGGGVVEELAQAEAHAPGPSRCWTPALPAT
jgi:hypothetical protein